MTNTNAQHVLDCVNESIKRWRAEYHAIPEGKRRNGIPVGKWARDRNRIICILARLGTAQMLCDWFARGVQPSYMDWERDVVPYLSGVRI